MFLGGSGLGLVQKVRLCVYCSGLERGGRKEGERGEVEVWGFRKIRTDGRGGEG